MNQLITYYVPVPTSAATLHTAGSDQRLLAVTVANTDPSNVRTFRLAVDRNGTEVNLIPTVPIASNDTLDRSFGFTVLQAVPDGSGGRVGDQLIVEADGSGLDLGVTLEVLRP